MKSRDSTFRGSNKSYYETGSALTPKNSWNDKNAELQWVFKEICYY